MVQFSSISYHNFYGFNYSFDADVLFKRFCEVWTKLEDIILFNNANLQIVPAATYFSYLAIELKETYKYSSDEYRFICKCIAQCMYQHGYKYRKGKPMPLSLFHIIGKKQASLYLK